MKNFLTTVLYPLLVFILMGCDDFLDAKPDKSLVIPTGLDDLQAILDATTWGMNDSPAIHLLSSDDIQISEDGFLSLTNPIERNAYLWSETIYENEGGDWSVPYVQVFYANTVLSQLENLTPQTGIEKDQFNQIKGSALFYRANAFFNLLSLFAPPYTDSNGDALGIPIKLSPDINDPISRVTLKTSYDQVFADLYTALELLGPLPEVKTRPSKWAVHALLSRIYLAIGEYPAALAEAESALSISDQLIDYNTVNTDRLYIFDPLNIETIFYNQMVNYSFVTSNLTFVNPSLYQMFDEDNDIRKSAFFTVRSTGVNFRGNYSGSFRYFSGLAVNELYLIKAECLARAGDLSSSLRELNHLLETRWTAGTYMPIEVESPDAALKIIMDERRKELMFRGLRWLDLRRLNTDNGFSVTLEREINGEIYILNPNSNKYVLPIPPNEINNSGIPQNDRKD